jgi:hypothetical protein
LEASAVDSHFTFRDWYDPVTRIASHDQRNPIMIQLCDTGRYFTSLVQEVLSNATAGWRSVVLYIDEGSSILSRLKSGESTLEEFLQTLMQRV